MSGHSVFVKKLPWPAHNEVHNPLSSAGGECLNLNWIVVLEVARASHGSGTAETNGVGFVSLSLLI